MKQFLFVVYFNHYLLIISIFLSFFILVIKSSSINEIVYPIDSEGIFSVDILYVQKNGTILLECYYEDHHYDAHFKLTSDGRLSRAEEKYYRDKSNITEIYPLNSDYLLVEYENQGKIYSWNGTLVQRTESNQNVNPIFNSTILKLEGNLTSNSFFATTEGGFGYAYIVNNSPIIDSPSINLKTYSVYVTFWEPETTDFGLHFLLDQYDGNDLSFGSCDPQIDGLGHYCSLELRTTEFGIKKTRGFTISFLQSGAVLKYDTNYQFLSNDSWESNSTSSKTYPLPYGGKITQTQKSDNSSVFNLSDQFGNQKESWNIWQDTLIILPNNTFLAAKFEKNHIIIYSKNLPHFLKNDTGYENPLIEITYPRLNTIIPFGWREINITYSNEISLSNNNNNNISIYQINETIPILRQSISGKNCRVGSDKKTIIVETILESTFNQPDKDYFIVVDNNFVKDAKYKEAIKGIRRNIWQFKTDGREKSKHAATLTGLLRLNTNGTSNFTESRNSSGFFETLEDQLALTIPVERHRIEIIDHKTDKSGSAGQEILQLKISSINDKLERNPMEIANDLDTMVKKKWLSPISIYSHTGFLDEAYGFQVKRDGLAVYIVITEITINYEYVLWLRKHAKPAALFTLLSAADIDALNLLYSKYANFDIFNAPISNRVEDLIFWGSGINIFIEDIPQFIIQSYYELNNFEHEFNFSNLWRFYLVPCSKRMVID
ncbi:hypothetical protein G9A89_015444 [Geosiphon pyriformis]|nr:hypothetical protein G9A89_015444 [Geosiphon pyriformis]